MKIKHPIVSSLNHNRKLFFIMSIFFFFIQTTDRMKMEIETEIKVEMEMEMEIEMEMEMEKNPDFTVSATSRRNPVSRKRNTNFEIHSFPSSDTFFTFFFRSSEMLLWEALQASVLIGVPSTRRMWPGISV